jgi:hypothetical protein
MRFATVLQFLVKSEKWKGFVAYTFPLFTVLSASAGLGDLFPMGLAITA